MQNSKRKTPQGPKRRTLTKRTKETKAAKTTKRQRIKGVEKVRGVKTKAPTNNNIDKIVIEKPGEEKMIGEMMIEERDANAESMMNGEIDCAESVTESGKEIVIVTEIAFVNANIRVAITRMIGVCSLYLTLIINWHLKLSRNV